MKDQYSLETVDPKYNHLDRKFETREDAILYGLTNAFDFKLRIMVRVRDLSKEADIL
jgi:hypothetical protein